MSDKRKKTIIGAIIIAIILILVITLILLNKNKNEEPENLQNIELTTELLDTEEALKAEVQKLQDPEYVERYAKEKFLYTKEDEIIIRKTDTN